MQPRREGGNAAQMPIDARHDTGRMSARVTREEGESAATLDQRGEVGFAKFSPEDQEITFPMPKAAVIRDFLQPYADRIAQGYMKTSGLSTITLSALTTSDR